MRPSLSRWVNGTASLGGDRSPNFASARALVENTELDAASIVRKGLAIAADICVYTNSNVVLEEIKF